MSDYIIALLHVDIKILQVCEALIVYGWVPFHMHRRTCAASVVYVRSFFTVLIHNACSNKYLTCLCWLSWLGTVHTAAREEKILLLALHSHGYATYALVLALIWVPPRL